MHTTLWRAPRSHAAAPHFGHAPSLVWPRLGLLFLALLASAAGSSAPAPAADRRRDPSSLSLAVFNARFLFDGRAPEGEAGFPWKNDPIKAREHLRAVAAILATVDADVVHVSEVEDIETLERLLLEMGDPSYRAYLVPGRDPFTRQNVGIITRVDPDEPLRRTDSWAAGPRGGPEQGVAKNLVAPFTWNELPVALLGAHLLAFPEDPERAVRREGQAEALRRFSLEEGPLRGRLLVLCGDLNDLDPEVTPDLPGAGLSAALPILREVDATRDDDDLVNAAAWLPLERRFSVFVDRDGDGLDGGLSDRSLTDHILLSPELAPALERVEVYDAHDPLGPSDHFPLKVTLRLDRLSLFSRGDVNRDGHIDLGDAAGVLARLFGGAALACEDSADANDDGRLDLADAVRIAQGTLPGGFPLPPPTLAAPGVDAWADRLSCGAGGAP